MAFSWSTIVDAHDVVTGVSSAGIDDSPWKEKFPGPERKGQAEIIKDSPFTYYRSRR